MPDSKISGLPSATEAVGRDILLVTKRSGNTTFTNKKIEVDVFFENITSNTVIDANLTVSGNTSLANVEIDNANVQMTVTQGMRVSGNGIIISTKLTPGSSSVDDIAYPQGKIAYDDNYLYIKTSSGVIKRIPLTSF